MDAAMRALTVAFVGAGVVLLGRALTRWAAEQRIREAVDLARGGIAVATVLLIGVVTKTSSAPGIVVAAVAFGGVLGVVQGRATRVRVAGAARFARRTPLGLAVWFAGIVVAQAGGVLDRAGVVELGLAVGWFSSGVLFGTVFGRAPLLRIASQLASTSAIVVLALAPVLLPRPEPAAAAQTPDCPPAIDGVSLDAEGTWSKPPDGRVFGSLRCGYQNDPAVGGYAAVTISWDDTPGFVQCPEPQPDPRDDPPLLNGGAFHETLRVNGQWSVYVDDHSASGQVSAASTKAVFDELYEAVAALASRCNEPEPMGDTTIPACPESFGPVVRSSVHSSPGEIGGSAGCGYDLPVADNDRTTRATLDGVYFSTHDGGRSACGPPELLGTRAIRVVSDSRDAWVTATVDGDISPAAARAAAQEYLTALEAVAAPCDEAESSTPPAGGETGTDDPGGDDGLPVAGVAPGGDNGEIPAEGGGTDDGGVDAAGALAAGVVGLAGAAAVSSTMNAQSTTGTGGGRRTWVTLSGDEARAVLAASRGDTVAIPADQQWGVYVEGNGVVITDDRLGSAGRVVAVEAVVEGDDGSIVVAVTVDAFDPAAPAAPAAQPAPPTAAGTPGTPPAAPGPDTAGSAPAPDAADVTEPEDEGSGPEEPPAPPPPPPAAPAPPPQAPPPPPGPPEEYPAPPTLPAPAPPAPPTPPAGPSAAPAGPEPDVEVRDTDADGTPDWVRDEDGTIMVDTDGDGVEDGVLAGSTPGTPRTDLARRTSDALVNKQVLPASSAGLLADFLSDPGATRVEVSPSIGRRLGSLPGVEVWGTEVRPGPNGGVVIGVEARTAGGSVELDIVVRANRGRIIANAEGRTGAGRGVAFVINQFIDGQTEPINKAISEGGRQLTGLFLDEQTGRIVVESAPRPTD